MTTFPVQNFFPEFVDNQILNKTQLNQLRIYLDEQNRLTRIRMVGMGIICGLQARISGPNNNKSITISEGYGVTSEGYLIEIPAINLVKRRKYHDPHIVENDLGQEQPVYEPWKVPDDEIDPTDPDPDWQIDVFELMTDTQIADPTFVEEVGNRTRNIRQNQLNGRVLVLYLEMNEDPLHSCLVTDCNNKGYNLEMNVRALLVKKERLSALIPCTGLEELISIPRFYAGLQKTAGINIPQITASTEINVAYQDIAFHLKDELVNKMTNAHTAYQNFMDLEEAGGSLATLDATLSGIISAATANQYHFDFLKDLCQAYNEFTKRMCSLTKDCCPASTFPRHLMIRDFVQNNEAESARWRNKFMPSPVRNVMHDDLKRAEQMFNRIIALANNFGFQTPEGIKITPSENEAFHIEKRALPYYYDLSETGNVWQLKSCCAAPLLSYAINDMQIPGANYLSGPQNPLTDQIRNHSFLRIEGHLGQDCRGALDTINQLKVDHNLDFDVVALQLQATADAATGLAEDADIQAIKDLLKQNNVQRRELERLVEGLFGDVDTAQRVAILRDLIIGYGQINNRRNEIDQLNENWKARRKLLVPPCDISHLESDYLLLRSETICIYDKLDTMLSFLSSFDSTLETLENFSTACVDFESEEAPEVDTQFNIGDQVVTEDDIAVTIVEMGQGAAAGGEAEMIAATNDFGDGKALRVSGRAARFEFANLAFPVGFVLLEFQTEEDFVELHINDENLYAGSLSELGAAEIPGFEIRVDSSVVNDIIQGLIYIGGQELGSVAIGGSRFSVDNICALGSTGTDALFNLTGGASFSVKNINAKKVEIDSRITEIKGSETINLSEVERENLKLELRNLEKERDTVTKMGNLIEINNNFRGAFAARNNALLNTSLNRNSFLRTRAAISFQSSNQVVMVLLSLVYGLLHLRSCVKELIKLLPKDIRCFNYCLFINFYKEIISTMIQIRLLMFCVFELVVQNLSNSNSGFGNVVSSLNLGNNLIFQALMVQIPRIQDVLTYWKKALHNCLHARFTTLYYTLEYTLLGGGNSWQQFTQKHTGMEHLAGVGFGDTFILVCDEGVDAEGEEASHVVADFTVSGGGGCCCEVDPNTICFPPVALPDYIFLVVPFSNGEPSGSFPITSRIKVVNNDFGLNDHPNISVHLPSGTSALGASLSLNEATNEITYSYDNQTPNYGLDTFEYTLRDDECNLEDTGQVMVLIKPVNIVTDPVDPPGGFMVGPTFTGTVVDDATSEPLIGASLVLSGTTTGAVTDIGGNFQFGGIPPGTYQLQSSFAGYQAQSTSFEVVGTGGTNSLGTIRMVPVPGATNPFIGNITNIATNTSILLGIKEDESIRRISGSFNERDTERLRIINTVREEAVIHERAEFAAAETFVKEDLRQPNATSASLAKTYENTIKGLTEAHKTATAKEKKAYRKTMEAVTHAYMDKLTLRNPEKLDKRSEKALTTATENMKEAKVSTNAVFKNWKGNDLKTEFKFGVVDSIGTTFKRR